MAAQIRCVASDGPMRTKVFSPPRPSDAGVIVYMDAFGWRPELDRMAARYAAAGYWTYLPDLYYRQGELSFPPVTWAGQAIDPAIAVANTGTTVEMTIADTGALVQSATAQERVRRFGTVGYCMGARHALGAAYAYPDSVRAAACLHGGRMVWDGPNSPHLYIPRTRARLYFAFARDDETCPPEHQRLIEETIAGSGARADIEHYDAAHGWTFPERYCHDPVAAERTWAKVLALLGDEVARRAR